MKKVSMLPSASKARGQSFRRVGTGVALAMGIILFCASFPNKASAAEEGAACPSHVFKEFLSKFSESAALQKRFTELPLKYISVLNEGDDPKTVEKLIGDFDKIPAHNGLVFPTRQWRRQSHLETKIQSDAKSKLIVVTVAKPDTDDIADYSFSLRNNCWVLTTIHSYAL